MAVVIGQDKSTSIAANVATVLVVKFLSKLCIIKEKQLASILLCYCFPQSNHVFKVGKKKEWLIVELSSKSTMGYCRSSARWLHISCMASGSFFHLLRTSTLILPSAIDNRLIVDFVSKLNMVFHQLLVSIIAVYFCFKVVKVIANPYLLLSLLCSLLQLLFMISRSLQLIASAASRSLLRLELNMAIASGFAEFIAIAFCEVATFIAVASFRSRSSSQLFAWFVGFSSWQWLLQVCWINCGLFLWVVSCCDSKLWTMRAERSVVVVVKLSRVIHLNS